MFTVRTHVFSGAVVLGLCMLSLGCAATPTTGYQRADSTSDALTDTRRAVAEAQPIVADMASKLNNLVNRPAIDLRPQYQEFANAVRDMQASEAEIRSRVTTMRNRRDAYMQQWQADIDEISGEELKDRATRRIDETGNSFRTLDEELDAMDEDFTQLLASVRDLQQFLLSDLTLAGLTTVRDLVEQVRTDETALQESLDAVMASLDDAATKIAPAVRETADAS